MTVRSLTAVFVLMRNNALQHKHLSYNNDEDDYDDTVALVPGKTKYTKLNSSPPDSPRDSYFSLWSEKVNTVHGKTDAITDKMEELNSLHEKHLKRPTLSDDIEEERAVEILTEEITQMFHSCQSTIKQMDKQQVNLSNHEKTVGRNMLSGIATNLQNLSIEFKKSQSAYLKKLKSREERSHQFFIDTDVDLMIGQSQADDIEDMQFQQGFSQDQVAFVNENATIIENRDSEIQKVVKSIHELSEIFQDLGNIIVEQSTIVDRIDYNIENAVIKTEAGLTQLKAAEEHQKKNTKLKVIAVMALITLVMIAILIIKQSL